MGRTCKSVWLRSDRSVQRTKNPLALAMGSVNNKKTRMKKDAKKGQLLTLDMVELDTTTQLYQTRKEQDAMYKNGYALK